VLFTFDPLWPDGIHGRNPDRMLPLILTFQAY
jgi:hypothetical protein